MMQFQVMHGCELKSGVDTITREAAAKTGATICEEVSRAGGGAVVVVWVTFIDFDLMIGELYLSLRRLAIARRGINILSPPLTSSVVLQAPSPICHSPFLP